MGVPTNPPSQMNSSTGNDPFDAIFVGSAPEACSHLARLPSDTQVLAVVFRQENGVECMIAAEALRCLAGQSPRSLARLDRAEIERLVEQIVGQAVADPGVVDALACAARSQASP